MIPLRDNVPTRTTPLVNWALIAVCAVVFLLQLGTPAGRPSMVERYGMIPARVLHPDRRIRIPDVEQVRTPFGIRERAVLRDAAPPAVPAWLTVLTCIFLHGGWLHFLGNVWFLFIFGDNVEDRFGHGRYLLLYLAFGAAASLAQIAAAPDSTLPTIGASGAIAGVMGAYFFLYPHAKVLTLVPIFFFIDVWVLPAVAFLGLWFVLQLLQGTLELGAMQGGGVAWWAHVGGFAAGLGVAAVMGRRQTLHPRVETVRPGTENVTRYRTYRMHLPRR